MFEYIVASIVAMGIGIIAAVIGLGGGFLYVPTLSLLFHLDFRTAMGTSLAVMIFTSFSASYWYNRQGKILYKIALILIPPAIIFSILGTALTHFIDTHILIAIFSCVLILISLEMLVPSFRFLTEIRWGPTFVLSTKIPSQVSQPITQIPYIHLLVWGAVGGLVSGVTGTSGGAIFVPALATVGVPVHYAVATSMFTVIATALAGSSSHALLGQISLPFVIAYGIGAAIGAALGTLVATRINEVQIRHIFGVLLIFIALIMFFGEAL